MEDQLISNVVSDTSTDQSKLPLEVYDLGVIDYLKALELQRNYHQKLIDGTQGDLLLICSHNPVFTCGTSTAAEHIYLPEAEFIAQGSPLVKVERGGSVTYHGPEQAIFYPIINLHNHKTDVGWYMRALEEVILRTLSEYDIIGIRVTGKTGVWIDQNTKIAFSGVRISRWCTLHGFAMNVLPCAERFSAINPCGLGDIKVVSMAELSSRTLSCATVTQQLLIHFIDVFGYGNWSP